MNILVKETVISAEAATVQGWLEAGNAILIDVRETSEYEQEHIPGALLLPMSSFDAELFPELPGKNIVLHCAIGKRSEAAGKMLLKEGHSNIIHMAGGLNAWKEAGYETEEEIVSLEPKQGSADTENLAASNRALPPSPGQVLTGEFMAPLPIGVDELSAAVGVKTDQLTSIIEGRASIDAETSLRLARYFCTDKDFWLKLQLQHDMAIASQSIGHFVQSDISPRLCA